MQSSVERLRMPYSRLHTLALGIAEYQPIAPDAINGRYKYQATFQYNNDWQCKFYSLKKVAPIVAETDTELVVITVYTFYF